MGFDAKHFRFRPLSSISAGRILRIRHGLGEQFAVSAKESSGDVSKNFLVELASDGPPRLAVFENEPVIELSVPFDIQLSQEISRFSDSYSVDANSGDIIATEESSFMVIVSRNGKKALLDLTDFFIRPFAAREFAICSSWKLVCYPDEAIKMFELHNYQGRAF